MWRLLLIVLMACGLEYTPGPGPMGVDLTPDQPDASALREKKDRLIERMRKSRNKRLRRGRN